MKKTQERILVVAAHPDDEVLGCGATIAKHVALGAITNVIIMGEGITSRKDLIISEKNKQKKQLVDSTKRANKILGVEKVILHQLPDNKFDTVPLLDIIHLIEETVDTFKPTVVYTHNHSDVNIDHRIVAEAVEAAVRPMTGQSLYAVYAFETPSSTEWNFFKKEIFSPHLFVDISSSLDRKLEALEAYSSEMRDFPHPRSREYIQSLARVRGGQGGMRAAEAFEIIYQRIV